VSQVGESWWATITSGQALLATSWSSRPSVPSDEMLSRLPRGLRGTGAQSHFEVGLSLWARKQGWRLVYDPSIVIDHFRAPRADYGRRDHPTTAAIRDRSYNLVASLIALEPKLLPRRALFGLLVGDREKSRTCARRCRGRYGPARGGSCNRPLACRPNGRSSRLHPRTTGPHGPPEKKP